MHKIKCFTNFQAFLFNDRASYSGYTKRADTLTGVNNFFHMGMCKIIFGQNITSIQHFSPEVIVKYFLLLRMYRKKVILPFWGVNLLSVTTVYIIHNMQCDIQTSLGEGQGQGYNEQTFSQQCRPEPIIHTLWCTTTL